MTLYEESECKIWTDPYISRQLLLAHLNVTTDAASRRPETISKTMNWILGDNDHLSTVIDLGCGPGLYAEEFAKAGLTVTGIDINEISLDYAQRSAKAKGLGIEYLFADYLGLNVQKRYDLAICIYCDFGALTHFQQDIFLKNAHRHLESGGILIFDVFAQGVSKTKTEGRTWTEEGKNGFLAKRHHFVLTETTHFREQRVWGAKHVVLEDRQKSKTFVLWDHYYTRLEITKRIEEFGFEVIRIEEDMVKANDFASSNVLFVKARKT
jgi:2-polyprenyl-3-methyl-5-hydroxy-6-metoxy-1,4-benzoquinol methylase